MVIEDPDPCRQLVATRFRVRISDARGKPVSEARVRVALVMPSMAMPTDVVACAQPTAASPPGYYVGVGTFTMTGTWRLDASAILSDGEHLKVSRLVEVR